mmetsp:Transcript_34906/g.81519  ORF Transcript_34906/g.81519 Transcript_34906/m.81519 type:complete len:218 (+) Transcript_34906:3-656(+)
MPLIYSLVAHHRTPLVEFTATTGNFQQVTLIILEKIPEDDARMSYTYDSYVFHLVIRGGLTFVTMCDQSFQRRIAFGFLDQVQKRFTQQFRIDFEEPPRAFSFNKAFSSALRDLMHHWSTSPDVDKVLKTRAEVDEVKDIMMDNIDQILERGEKISLLVDKAELMNEQAIIFKRTSTAVRRRFCWLNAKMTVLVVLVALLVIAGIVIGVWQPWKHHL